MHFVEANQHWRVYCGSAAEFEEFNTHGGAYIRVSWEEALDILARTDHNRDADLVILDGAYPEMP